MIVDTTAPVLSEILAIKLMNTDTTPEYKFNSNEEGTISIEGSCSSQQLNAESGNNSVTLNLLNEGTYSDCKLYITDAAGNKSNILNIPKFNVFDSGVLKLLPHLVLHGHLLKMIKHISLTTMMLMINFLMAISQE